MYLFHCLLGIKYILYLRNTLFTAPYEGVKIATSLKVLAHPSKFSYMAIPVSEFLAIVHLHHAIIVYDFFVTLCCSILSPPTTVSGCNILS